MKWYKRDPEAALRGMQILTLEERGAYNTVLDLIYRSDNLVRDDDRFLAGHMGCDLRVWRRIKARLIDLEKIQLEGGYIRNVTASLVLSQAVAAADVNASKGRKSGIARSKTNALDEQRPEPKSNHRDRDIDRGKPPISPATVVELRPAPEPRGVAALRAEAVERKAKAGRWLEFRAAYPKREGGQGWPVAERKYTALVAAGIPEEVLIGAARAYAAHLTATGKIGTQYVKQAQTWITQEGWKDEYTTGTGRRKQSELMDACDDLIREAKARVGDRAPDQGIGEGDWIEHDPAVSY
jgi:uncharacterized protein YdaU (DUF1376 family)